jgi:hypothetical protein
MRPYGIVHIALSPFYFCPGLFICARYDKERQVCSREQRMFVVITIRNRRPGRGGLTVKKPRLSI